MVFQPRFGCRIVLPVDWGPPGQEGDCHSMGLAVPPDQEGGCVPGCEAMTRIQHMIAT